MRKRKKTALTVPVNNRFAIRMPDPGERSKESVIAEYAMAPHVTMAVLAQRFQQWTFDSQTGITELIEELRSQERAVLNGNMDRAEAMLIAQAHSLTTIFSSLAHRAAANMSEYPDAAETYMKLALRAQSQCRATLETLATIKNPPNVAFVKQANIANGPQQVNNGVPAPRAEEIAIMPTELSRLTDETGQRVDFGAQGAAVGSDPAMATVEAINRPKDD